ncbi:hypothetical protein ACM66B_002122 [Microbotryomycetes sp. NB124-2]
MATASATTRSRRPSRFNRDDTATLSLDYFLTRAKVLSLYRQFIRATKGFGDIQARWDTVQWVRQDFERYRFIQDQTRIKTLISMGQRQLKQINQTGHLIGTDGAKWRGLRTDSSE